MGFLIGMLVIVAIISFLLGSIPWGVIISKIFYKTDIREHGSGNIGTTNAMRTMGKAGGIAVFLLDFGKGLLAGLVGAFFAVFVLGAGDAFALFASFYPGEDLELVASHLMNICVSLSFVCCIAGHIYSPWLKFKGGKGVAVAGGCMLVTFGVGLTALELFVFVVVMLITRYASVGSMTAALGAMVIAGYLFLFQSFEPVAFLFCMIAAAMVFWAHRGNIGRLAKGTENRIGSKKSA